MEGFPIAERIQDENVRLICFFKDILWKYFLKVVNTVKYILKVDQVADIDVLPESERMMSDRMRQGGPERLLWADDAMVAVRLPKV